MMSPLNRRIHAIATSVVVVGGLLVLGMPAASADTLQSTGVHEAGTAGQQQADQNAPAPLPVMAEAVQLARQFAQMQGAQLEQAYMAEMIDHHQMAIMMARMEVANGKRPSLKALARQIISSQQQEIGQMTACLLHWYGLTPQQAMANAPARVRSIITQLDAKMQQMMMAMKQPAPGNATDLVFLQHMIPHHRMAIIETRAAVPGFLHPQLMRMGRQVVASQSAEVQMMTVWLRTWYGHATDHDGAAD
jgi:uncharacterized protein (DUF305 family)